MLHFGSDVSFRARVAIFASLDGGRQRLFIKDLWWPQLDRVTGGNTAAYTGGS